MHRVGAPLRGVRGRTEVVGSDDFPGSTVILLRTHATQSRPYPKAARSARSADPTHALGNKNPRRVSGFLTTQLTLAQA